MARMAKMTVEALRAAASRLLAHGDVPLVTRPTHEDKALAWIKAAPRTTGQIARLLGISPNYASVLLYRMRQRGLIVSTGVVEGKRCPFRLYTARGA